MTITTITTTNVFVTDTPKIQHPSHISRGAPSTPDHLKMQTTFSCGAHNFTLKLTKHFHMTNHSSHDHVNAIHSKIWFHVYANNDTSYVNELKSVPINFTWNKLSCIFQIILTFKWFTETAIAF